VRKPNTSRNKKTGKMRNRDEVEVGYDCLLAVKEMKGSLEMIPFKNLTLVHNALVSKFNKDPRHLCQASSQRYGADLIQKEVCLDSKQLRWYKWVFGWV
jgi:hypothetical protein